MRNRWFAFTIGTVIFSMTSAALAKDTVRRVPLKPALLEGARAPIVQAEHRSHEIELARYERVAKVIRERTEGKSYATFTAEPQLIERGAVMLLEIRSVASSGAVPRWRCIARNDVAECLGAPVRIRYLPDDERVVLTAQLRPQSELADAEAGLASR